MKSGWGGEYCNFIMSGRRKQAIASARMSMNGHYLRICDEILRLQQNETDDIYNTNAG